MQVYHVCYMMLAIGEFVTIISIKTGMIIDYLPIQIKHKSRYSQSRPDILPFELYDVPGWPDTLKGRFVLQDHILLSQGISLSLFPLSPHPHLCRDYAGTEEQGSPNTKQHTLVDPRHLRSREGEREKKLPQQVRFLRIWRKRRAASRHL